MKKQSAKKSGFTLIELMIVVAILGILAAIAIPAFATYIRRSKTSEAYGNIEGLFKAVSTYYNKDFTTGSTMASVTQGHCTIPSQSSFAGAPNDTKQLPAATAGTGFDELNGVGFNPGTSYYSYSTITAAALCGGGTTTSHYTLQAYGNLDNDNAFAFFTLPTFTNLSNEIYKGGSVFAQSELE